MDRLKFRYFLLNENTEMLGSSIGDILNAMQTDLQELKGMSVRELQTRAELIANRIERILKTHWGSDNTKHLEVLQTVGVAIRKCIEEKDDLENVYGAGIGMIEKLLSDMGTPINKMGGGGEAEPEAETQVSPPPQEPEPQPQPQPAPNQQPAQENMPQNQPQGM